MKPTRWQASCYYRDLRTRERRKITASDTSRARAETRLLASVELAREESGRDMLVASARLRERLLWLRERHEEDTNLAPRTVTQYISVIDRHLLSTKSQLADMQLRDITAPDIKQELLRIRREGGESTVSHARAQLARIFSDAVDSRAIPISPVDGVKKLPRERKKEPVYKNGSSRSKNRALSTEEVEAIEEGAREEPGHVADLLLLLLDTGLRISEAVSLRWEDVDLDRGTIAITGKLVRVKGQGLVWDPFTKDLRSRTLPLRSRSRDALKRRWRHRMKGPHDAYVFQTPRGGKPDPDNYNTLLRRAFDRMGLKDVTVHTIRRTVERDLELAGATVGERETFMGHTEQVARKYYAEHGAALRTSVVHALEDSKCAVSVHSEGQEGSS